jgi:hypothetical protein
MPNIDEFLQRASDCLALSERSLVLRHKELFLRMAQTWLTLADQEFGSRSRLQDAVAGSESAPIERSGPSEVRGFSR